MACKCISKKVVAIALVGTAVVAAGCLLGIKLSLDKKLDDPQTYSQTFEE